MARKTIDVVAQTVVFDFDEAGTVGFELSRCTPEMVIQLALHGLSQKAGDAYAGAKAATDGTAIDPNVWAMQQAADTIEQVYAGNWTVRTPGAGAAISDLARALAEVMPDVTEAEAAERLSEASKEDKAALRKHPAVKAVLERIKAERATAKAAAAEAAAGSAQPLSFDSLGI